MPGGQFFATFYKVDRGDLIDNVIFDQRPTRREATSPAYTWGKNVSGEGRASVKALRWEYVRCVYRPTRRPVAETTNLPSPSLNFPSK